MSLWEENLTAAGVTSSTAAGEYVRCSLPACSPLVPAGGAIAFDYRVIHRGTGNTDHCGRADQPMLYFVYSKPWFADVVNFPTDAPLFAVPPCG